MQSLSLKIVAANKTLISDGNHGAVEEFFTPDYIAHLTDKDVQGGYGLIREFLELYQQAFPNPTVDVEILMETEDRVAWQRTLRAKHEGAYKGFPASGRVIVWRDVATSHFRNGLIAEEWVISDLAEQLLLSRKNVKK